MSIAVRQPTSISLGSIHSGRVCFIEPMATNNKPAYIAVMTLILLGKPFFTRIAHMIFNLGDFNVRS